MLLIRGNEVIIVEYGEVLDPRRGIKHEMVILREQDENLDYILTELLEGLGMEHRLNGTCKHVLDSNEQINAFIAFEAKGYEVDEGGEDE